MKSNVYLLKANGQLHNKIYRVMVWVLVFNTTFNNISVISWQSAVLVEESCVTKENH
jgi:hypothetical protein